MSGALIPESARGLRVAALRAEESAAGKAPTAGDASEARQSGGAPRILTTAAAVETPVARLDGGPYTEQGRTTNCVVWWEQDLGANGPVLADAVLDDCERIYWTLRYWFGGTAPGGLPFNIYIRSGSDGGYHYGCSGTDIYCDAFGGTDGSLVDEIVVAEVAEVFMAAQGRGWDCGASHGEALSRLLAFELYPSEASGFLTAGSWLSSPRADFVNNTDPTDGNSVSTGCAILFLYYLRDQLGFDLQQIIGAGAATLAQTYKTLTGDGSDPFGPFSWLLARHFPPGSPAGLPTDNPWPLGRFGHFYTTSTAERDNAIAQYRYQSEGTSCYVYPGEPDGTAPLYRLLSKTGDHFYTMDLAERDGAMAVYGYGSEHVAAWLFPTPQPGTVPLYRLYSPNVNHHFYTTSKDERDKASVADGYWQEGIAGYLFPGQQDGTSPFYRLVNTTTWDHFYTADSAERDSAIANYGYQDEGVIGYVYAGAPSGTVPLYRVHQPTTDHHFYTVDLDERDASIVNDDYRSEGIAAYVYPAGGGAGTEALYRLYNSWSDDHFYTTSAAERDNAVTQYGYADEGTACNVYASATDGTTPLWRLLG